MSKFNEFLGDDAGTVTIDWIVLTAFSLIMGITVIYALFNGGVATAVEGIDTFATDMISSIDVGQPPSAVNFGG